MSKIFLIIPGRCMPKERPRFNMKTGTVYTPKKTLDYESIVKANAAMNIGKPLEGAVEISVIVEQKIPKSWSKKKKLAVLNGEEVVTSVQDLDNMLKSVTDGLNKIAYKDDRQIVKIVAEKRYSETDQVIVVIKEIENANSDKKK